MKSVKQEEFREWKGFTPIRHSVVFGCSQARPEAGPTQPGSRLRSDTRAEP